MMDQTTTLIDGVPTLEIPNDMAYIQQNLERATFLIRESTYERNDLQVQLSDVMLENDRLKLMVEQRKT